MATVSYRLCSPSEAPTIVSYWRGSTASLRGNSAVPWLKYPHKRPLHCAIGEKVHYPAGEEVLNLYGATLQYSHEKSIHCLSVYLSLIGASPLELDNEKGSSSSLISHLSSTHLYSLIFRRPPQTPSLISLLPHLSVYYPFGLLSSYTQSQSLDSLQWRLLDSLDSTAPLTPALDGCLFRGSACTRQPSSLCLIEHPQFLNNQLFIGGDSYSSIPVPMIVQHVVDGNQIAFMLCT
ncbi:hypothetical protein Q3G72_009922 [Acer saccharum]|nr:hypothetical protein Q3G72_009840 [Acer saccharum]KAK1575990.1 hypothetical protein Q3G72_009922 [Acer saccharum]